MSHYEHHPVRRNICEYLNHYPAHQTHHTIQYMLFSLTPTSNKLCLDYTKTVQMSHIQIQPVLQRIKTFLKFLLYKHWHKIYLSETAELNYESETEISCQYI